MNETIKQNVLKLQNANASPNDIEAYVKSASQQGATPNATPSPSQPSNPSLLDDEKSAWEQSRQDSADFQSGKTGFGTVLLRQAGDGFNMVVNKPVSHVLGAIQGGYDKFASSPLNPSIPIGGGNSTKLLPTREDFNKNVETVKQFPQVQSAIKYGQDFQNNNPDIARNIGSAWDIAKGIGTIFGAAKLGLDAKDAFTSGQASNGISKTLVNNLNYDPALAEHVTSTIDKIPNVAQYVANGNFAGAKTIVDNAIKLGGGASYSGPLLDVADAIKDLSTVPFNPTAVSGAVSKAGGLMGSVANTGKGLGKEILKGVGLIGGAGALAKYEGWGK